MKTRDSFKPRLIFWTVGLVILLAASASACASAVVTSPSQEEAPVLPPVEDISPTATPIIPTQAPVQTPVTEPSSAVEVQPVATSRGPSLHATDPSEIQLASGQLQLIEAFNFW